MTHSLFTLVAFQMVVLFSLRTYSYTRASPCLELSTSAHLIYITAELVL